MHGYLEVQRRTLFEAYQEYLAADRALQLALHDALSWFPKRSVRKTILLGDRGSRLRRVHDQRDHALSRLLRVRQELEEARARSQTRDVRIVKMIAVYPS